MKYYLGIDIGGTKCAVLLAAYKGDDFEIISKEKFLTEAKLGPTPTINRLYEAVDKLLLTFSLTAADIEAIGISCGGPLNSRTGRILSPPNLYGWDDIPIVEMFETRYKISTFLQNDANAGALAEWKFGAAKGHENVIFLTCGTGMGAGLILNGKLYDGTNGFAGEVGHIRLAKNGPVGFGKSGSFEGFCSGGGIAQIAKTMVLEQLQQGIRPEICPDISMLDNLTAKTVGDAAEAGDKLAIRIYNLSAEYLGMALSLLIDILNPEVVVIGSIYSRSKELYQEKMTEVINREAIPAAAKCCKILPASLKEAIGDYACLSVAVYCKTEIK